MMINRAIILGDRKYNINFIFPILCNYTYYLTYYFNNLLKRTFLKTMLDSMLE